MNAREIIVLTIGVSFVTGMLAQEAERAIPSPEQSYWITLQTYPTLWEANFYPNGAAMLDFGGAGGFNPQAAAPKGSFAFKEVYDLLVPRMKPKPSERYLPNEERTADQQMQMMKSGRDMVVRVIGISPATSCVGYIEHTEENDKAVRALMFRLRDKALPVGNVFTNKEKFEGVLAKFPFLAVDEPVHFKYTKYNEKAAQSAWDDVEEWQRKESEDYLKRRGEELKQEMSESKLLAAGEERLKAGMRNEESEIKQQEQTSRPWLYVSILSALCAGAVLWLIRRKR